MKTDYSKWLVISFSILIGIFSMYMLSCICFLFHININIFCPIASLIISIISIFVTGRYIKLNFKDIFFSYLIFFALSAVSLLFGYSTIDRSWDGITYHQEAIILFHNGYNPVYDNIEKFAQSVFHTPLYWNLIWVENYPKLAEITQACIFKLTGNIESAKMINMISLFALFGYSYCVLSKSFLKNANKYIKTLVSIILVINPVVISQVMTFYTDFFVYVFFMIILLGIIDIETESQKNILPWMMILMSSVCLVNVKLGGLLYTIVPIVFYAVYLFLTKAKNNLKKLAVVSLIIIVSALICGVNPYFTNIKQGRAPFYPLIGKDSQDVVTQSTPAVFHKKSSAYKFLSSTFSRVDNFGSNSKERHHIKIPFIIYKKELKAISGIDTRICGFGIFWSGILLLSLILAIKIKFNKENLSMLSAIKIKFEDEKDKNIFLLIFTIALVLLVANPHSWWARYCPHLWIMPLFIVLYRYKEKYLNKAPLICIYFILLAMFLNSGIQAFYAYGAERENHKKINEMCEKIKQSPKKLMVYGMFEVGFFEKLREKNIPFETVSEDYYNKHKSSFKDKNVLTYWNYEEIVNDK